MTDAPLSALDFAVAIRVAGRPEPLCEAAFAECDGLEIDLDVERLRDGGSGRQTFLVGGATPGTVTLRRGMTPTLDLWHWMSAVIDDPSLRADATVAMLDAQGAAQVVFALAGCVPVRLRGPRLPDLRS